VREFLEALTPSQEPHATFDPRSKNRRKFFAASQDARPERQGAFPRQDGVVAARLGDVSARIGVKQDFVERSIAKAPDA
jgi:hypothetical protein